jgi:hypothetical protein
MDTRRIGRCDGDFWERIMRHYDVQKVRFSRHIPVDQAYRMGPQPTLGEPATLILPAYLARELPPVPTFGSSVNDRDYRGNAP